MVDMNYIRGHSDPKEIKSKLEESKVRCNVKVNREELMRKPYVTADLSIGDDHEILIVNAFYEYDDCGIWWELDIIYYDEMISEVIVTNPELIENLTNQSKDD